MAKHRELWASLVHPAFAGPVMPVAAGVEVDAADAYPVFVATRKCRVRRASVAHTGGLSAATYALRNVTDSVDVSSATIDADALAADTAAAFTIGTSYDLDEGDVLSLVVTGTGTTFANVTIEVEFLELKSD